MSETSVSLDLVSSVDDKEWDGLLAQDDRSLLFQRPDWNRRFVRYHPGSHALWWEAREGSTLVGGLPFVQTQRGWVKAWVSGAAGTFGGPVAAAEHATVESRLVESFCRHQRTSVVRRELVWSRPTPPAGAPDAVAIEAAAIDLTQGFDHFLRESFPKKRRNECNRSDRRGLAIDPDGGVEDIPAFWALYAEQAHAWGVTPEPADYLRAILEEEPSSRFFVAKQDGEVVGGHLCFELPDELFAWVGTTRRLPTTFPSSLLIREEARFAADRELARLDLGSSVGLSGVANYKRLLGADGLERWLVFQESWWLKAAGALRRPRSA